MTARKVVVVFDCMIYLQGAGRRGGPARRCLELVDAGEIRVCVSPATLSEIADILSRPIIRQKFPLLDSNDTEMLLRSIRTKAELLTNVPNILVLPRDRGDEMYLDLAAAANADYLVTWNDRHLTYLMRRDTPEGVEFGRCFPAISIIDPVTFLQEIAPRKPQ